jgi:hypothetical protein
MRRDIEIFHVAAAACVTALLACSVDGDDGEDDFDYSFQEVADDADPWLRQPDAAPAEPRLRLMLTDAPADVDAVFVTFEKLEVHYCGEGAELSEEDCESGSWVTVSEESVTFDLLTLQGGVTAELGLADLPAGAYGQIRLHLSDASVVVDAEEFALTVPPGVLKLNGGFALEPGMQTEITIDFDADQSIHFAPGNGWMMSPVIAIVGESTAEIPDVEEPEDEEPEEGGDEWGSGGEDEEPEEEEPEEEEPEEPEEGESD